MGFDEGEEIECFCEKSSAGDFERVSDPTVKESATDYGAGDILLFVGREKFYDIEADFGEFGKKNY